MTGRGLSSSHSGLAPWEHDTVVSMSNDPTPNRCLAPAPEALSGHLGVLKCRLTTRADGTHEGYHKTSKSIQGLGKVIIRWRQGPIRRPPEIMLPTPGSIVLNPRAAFRQ